MRYFSLLVGAALLATLGACSDDTGVNPGGPPPPAAPVRFVNVVVDTGAVDLRFVDQVENLPQLQGIAFRGHSGMYAPAEPGARQARVFPSSSNISLTSIRLVDETVTLTASTRHTFVYAGRAGANAPDAERHRLAILTDPAAPTPPANQIAFKVLHGMVGQGAVDVYIVPVESADDPTPADFATNNAAVIGNVGFLAQSDYVNVATRPATEGALYRFVVTAAGSTTPIFAATPDQPGAASTVNSVGPQPGVQISGSVMTAVVAPGSIPGTRQSAAANQSPTVFVMIDKVLNP